MAALSLHALVVWALCAATLLVGRSVTSMETALAVHALAAPVFAALVTWSYARRRERSPLATAAGMLAVIALVDLVLVATVMERSLDMFRSVLGTWAPFGFIFAASWASAAAARWRGRTRRGGPRPDLRAQRPSGVC